MYVIVVTISKGANVIVYEVAKLSGSDIGKNRN